jgi:hypothetical protein
MKLPRFCSCGFLVVFLLAGCGGERETTTSSRTVLFAQAVTGQVRTLPDSHIHYRADPTASGYAIVDWRAGEKVLFEVPVGTRLRFADLTLALDSVALPRKHTGCTARHSTERRIRLALDSGSRRSSAACRWTRSPLNCAIRGVQEHLCLSQRQPPTSRAVLPERAGTYRRQGRD